MTSMSSFNGSTNFNFMNNVQYNNNNNHSTFLQLQNGNIDSQFGNKINPFTTNSIPLSNNDKISGNKASTFPIQTMATPNNNIAQAKPSQLLNDPQAFGFQKFQHQKREQPRFLINQQPQFKPREFKQDHWDKLNQDKMIKLEESIEDFTELYETLKKMRDNERKIMEKKGLVDQADFSKDLNDAIIFQGTCLDMCPVFERARRNVEYTVFSYEKNSPDDKKAARGKALKVFARPAAAAAPPLPSDVRPPHILVKSLDYIIDNLLTTLPKSEGFLWDRMRSIRQDFTYQNYSGPEAVDCNERIVRIHLLIIHIMIKTNSEFSLQQELEQLHKSLITLSEIYDDVRANGGECPNEAEFRAYSLLSKIRDPQYDQTVQELPSNIFNNNLVQLAICFRNIISNSNFTERGHIKTENSLNFYTRFFQLIKSNEVPFLMGSFLQIYLSEIRFYAVKAISHSINKKLKPISLSYFINLLCFNSADELKQFADHYSITVTDTAMDLRTLTYHSHRIPEKQPLKLTYLQCVNEKIGNKEYSQIINCGSRTTEFRITPVLSDQTSSLKEWNFKEEPHNITIPSTNEVEPSLLPNKAFGKPVLELNKPKFSPIVNEENTVLPPVKTMLPSTVPTQISVAVNEDRNIPKNNVQPVLNFPVSSKFSPMVKEAINIPKLNNQIIENEQKPKELTKTDRDINLKNEKRKQDNELKYKALSSICKDMIQNTTRKTVSDTFEHCMARKKSKAQTIDLLASELYSAFLHEKLYNIYLSSRAEKYNNSKLLKVKFRQWKQRYLNKRKEKDQATRHKEQLQTVQKQLGVPVFKRTRQLLDTPGNNSNTSFLVSSDKKRKMAFSPIVNETNSFSKALKEKNSLWEPLDFKRLYLKNIEKSIPSSMNMNIDILLFLDNWSSIPNSWILSKFGLSNSTSVQTFEEGNVHLTIKGIDKYTNPKMLKNTQLVIFNTGVTENNIFDLELKLQKDGEELIRIVTNASLHSNICFNLLIIYWDSSETKISGSDIARFLKIKRIEESFSNVLLNIGFVKITGDSPHKSLEQGLSRMARDFKYQLTDKGRSNSKNLKKRYITGSKVQNEQTNNMSSFDNKMKKIIDAENMMYQRQLSKKNTYAHLQSHIMASPRLSKKKLPVLLSASKSTGKFKTPIVNRCVSLSTPPLPSHLGLKVQNISHGSNYHNMIMHDTPSHSSNLPNSSIITHQTPKTQEFNSSVTNSSNRIFETSANNLHLVQTPLRQPTDPQEVKSSTFHDQQELEELRSLIETVKKRVQDSS